MLASSLGASDPRRTTVRVVLVPEPAPFADRPCLRAARLPTPRALFPRTVLTPVTLRRPVLCLLPVLDCEGPRSRPALLDRLPGLSPAARALRGLIRAPRRCILLAHSDRVVMCRALLTLQATSKRTGRLPVPVAENTSETSDTPGASAKRVEKR